MGKVTAVKDGRVVVDLGSEHGLQVGDRVGIISCCDVQVNPESGPAWVCPDDESVKAVVELTLVGPMQSSGQVGTGGAAVKGDLVFPTTRAPTHEKWFPGFPQQWTSVWDLSLRLRLIPGVMGGGVGFPFEFSLTYQLPVPVKVGVYSEPAMVGVDGDVFVAHAILGASVSFSSRYFEVGVGVGGHVDSMGPARNLALVQMVRLGASDGLMLKMRNTFGLGAGPGSGGEGLHWDSIHGEIRVPVSWRVRLYLDGGGGGGFTNMWWMRWTTGVHILLRGKGGPGTVTLPIGIGGGVYEFWDDDCDWTNDTCDEALFATVILVTGVDLRF